MNFSQTRVHAAACYQTAPTDTDRFVEKRPADE